MLPLILVTLIILAAYAIHRPAASAAAQARHNRWQTSWASAYSTADSPGNQGCPGAGPLRDDTLTFASLAVPCGTRVQFCAGRRCVIAVRTDSGPYVAGRLFDLSLGLVRALGFPTVYGWGVRTVRWRLA